VTSQPVSSERAHARHDRLLILRQAAGDPLDPTEMAAARELLDTCPACAALVDEIALIARTTTTLEAPVRTRDFRLTVQDAERLRSSRFRRLLDRLASPGWVPLRPLAGATLAIGLVLVGVSGTIPRPAAAPAGEPLTVLEASPSTEDTGGASTSQPPSDHAAAPAASPGEPRVQIMLEASPAPDAATFNGAGQTAGTDQNNQRLEERLRAASPAPTDTAVAEVAPQQTDRAGDQPAAIPVEPDDGAPSVSTAVLALGALLAVTGFIVLALSLVASRITRDRLVS
jgi:hypothetical protein